jgi:hypothetical protein
MSNDLYSRVIEDFGDKQVRLTVNEFREVEYIHLREYYQDMDETWLPTKKGISLPLTIENTRELFTGLLEILSLAESKELILEHFKELMEITYQ